MATKDILVKLGVSRTVATKYADSIDACAKHYNINTRLRFAMFLAQILHESGMLSTMVENMNYSADRLLVIFPKYFDSISALAYARQPEKIGNRVYANRMGNGSEASGDGYKYRGRGAIQITGKDSYAAFGANVNVDAVGNPTLLEDPQYAILSAGWFWNTRGLNTLADSGDIVACTKRINGGTNGLQDRTALYNKALNLI